MMLRNTVTCMLTWIVFVSAARAQVKAPPLGSLDFRPSVERPIGWRGDGTGLYPGATPPITWGRKLLCPIQEYRCLALEPADGADPRSLALQELHGQHAGGYAVTDWLVLGPFSSPQGAGEALNFEAIPAEGMLQPREGEKVGKLTWTRSKGADLDLNKLLGKTEGRELAYAFTHVFAPHGGGAAVRVRGDHSDLKFRIYVNGKSASNWSQHRHVLEPGWNRVLIKLEAPPGNSAWLARIQLCALARDVRYESNNVRWITPMPGYSYATPIVVGDRLFITSEPNDLICLDKNTGKVLWIRSRPTWAALTTEQKKGFDDRDLFDKHLARLDELNRLFVEQNGTLIPNLSQERRKLAAELLSDRVKKANDAYRVPFGWGGGNSGPTPTSDGAHVYVWHGETGVLACCDLEGRQKWIHFHHSGNGGEHGINSSPIIVGDKILMLGGRCVLAFDRATGKEAWRQKKYVHPCYPTLVSSRMGNTPVVVAANGSVYRVSDGTILQSSFGRDDGECASPVLNANRYYLISRAGFVAAQLPDQDGDSAKVKILNRITPDNLSDRETYPVASPVFHQGLVYATHSGHGSGAGRGQALLFAIDPLAERPVYRERLDFFPANYYGPSGAGCAANLAVAGKYLYVMDNRGTTLVIEPGVKYKIVARNTLVHLGNENSQEVTQSTPIFEGARIYYRAEQNFYCIEQR